MNTNQQKPAKITKAQKREAMFRTIAARWEERPERLEQVADQVREIFDKLIEWGWSQPDHEELDHATICYSRVVVSYECCQWLPFDLVPSWEDDLFCVLMDETRWLKYRDRGRCTSRLAFLLGKKPSTKSTPTPRS